MLTLNQNESNLLYWTKGWYESKGHESFWPQIGAIYAKHYAMTADNIEGIYRMVRTLWLKILDVLPNKDRILDQYEEETLPSKARYYWGAPNHGNYNYHCDDKFSTEDIIKARICVMASQLGGTKVSLYKMTPISELEGLVLKEGAKEKLSEMALANNEQ